EKFQLLKLSDIYVSTSQHEGFGLVFLEAMASGLPIVCYDHGGQTDFLEDKKTGFVVPLNRRDTFRERCERLIANPMLRRTLGTDNRARVEGFYIETCALKHENLFVKVLNAAKAYRRVLPNLIAFIFLPSLMDILCLPSLMDLFLLPNLMDLP